MNECKLKASDDFKDRLAEAEQVLLELLEERGGDEMMVIVFADGRGAKFDLYYEEKTASLELPRARKTP